MIKEIFLGHRPSRFQPNPIVQVFIISEILIWSAWNFVVPIFAVFATTKIPGGTLEIAASAYSSHLIGRVISELISGKYLTKATDKKKFIFSIVGISLISIGFIGFAFAKEVYLLYVYYAITGMGIGIASPAKNSLFAMHLDKNKEAAEWSIYDALVFTGTASAAALGGFIATEYGFSVLFMIAAIVNLLGILPYVLYINTSTNGGVVDKILGK